LLKTIACLVILVLAVHLVHSQQMYLKAGVFFQQAERALQQHEYARAADLLQRYLDYQPEDTEAIALYASALEQASSSDQSRFKTFLLLEQVLRREPQRLDARQHAIQAAIDLDRNQDAIRHLKYLLTDSPTSSAPVPLTDAQKAELEHRLGKCQEAVGEYDESAKSFGRAIALAPSQIDSYVLLAELFARRLKQPDEAAQVMSAMLAANARSWQAFLARARFYQGQGRLDKAASELNLAAEIAPQQNEVLLAAAELSLLQGDLAGARKRVPPALQQHPKEERLYRSLAALEARSGLTDEAIADLQRGLAELPQSASLHVHLAELLVDAGRKEEAGKLLEWVKSSPDSRGAAEYVEGLILTRDRQWPLAVEKLTHAQTRLGLASEWTSNLCVNLARCFRGLGESERQMTACKDALTLNPANPQARLELGRILLESHLPEGAVVELRFLASSTQPPPAETWPLLAQALLDRGQRRWLSGAEWKELDEILLKVANANPNGAALPCLTAERFSLQGDGAKALAVLEAALAERPDEVSLWVKLAQVQAKLGQSTQALATLERADRRLGPSLELYQAVINYWSTRLSPQGRASLASLNNGVAEIPPSDRVRLLRELSTAFLLQGDKREAEKALRQLSMLLPKDTSSRAQLFDLFLNDNRDAEATGVIAELRRIEGEEGALWRAGEVSRGIWKAWRGDSTLLDSSRKRLGEIQKRRKDWGRAALLQGYLDDLGGRTSESMESLRRAIELGEQPLGVVLRVAQWHADQHRFAEAGQILRQLENQRPLPNEHARLAVEVALHNDELKRALSLSQRVAATNDYRDKLWLANVQWLAGQPLEAEKTLREASRVAPGVPDVWVARVRHLTRTKQSDRLDEVFAELAQKVPDDRLEFTRARCLEAAGRLAEAETRYKQLLANGAPDPALLRQVAEFYLRGEQSAKARPLLEQLLQPTTAAPPDLVGWARRQVVLVSAMGGRAKELDEAVNLLNKSSGANAKVEDTRLRAFLLAKTPSRQAEAVQLFEKTLGKQSLDPDERFLLAQVYDANQQDEQSNREMRTLLKMHRDNPRYLAYYIQTLLARGDIDFAGSYLSILETLEPQSTRTQELRTAYQKAKSAG
jgi:tetratricopeptide (TPR) repeat protein